MSYEDVESEARPALFGEHARQTAVGVFVGLAAWSLLMAVIYLIAWLLR